MHTRTHLGIDIDIEVIDVGSDIGIYTDMVNEMYATSTICNFQFFACVYVYIYGVYIDIYIHTHVQKHIHTYVYNTYIHTYLPTYLPTDLPT